MIFRDNAEAEEKRYTGVIKFYKSGRPGEKGRGYGFLIMDHTEQEYFFHFQDLLIPTDQCKANLRVSFELVEGDRNTQAIAIQKLKDEEYS